MGWVPPGFSVHWILQARVLKWVAIPFSRGSSWPWDWTWVSCIAGRFFTIWATSGSLHYWTLLAKFFHDTFWIWKTMKSEATTDWLECQPLLRTWKSKEEGWKLFSKLSLWVWSHFILIREINCVIKHLEAVTDFIFLGSKIIMDSDCSHEIKRRLLLWRKAMTNLDSVLKSRDIPLPTKVCIVKAMISPVVM